MMYKKSFLLSAALAVTASLFLTPTTSSAVEITGGISFAGGYTPDDSDLTLATRVTFGPTVVLDSNGDFTLPIFTPVAMADYLEWEPSFTVSPSNPLWSVGDFSFDLTSLAVTAESSTSITLNGLGVVKHADFDDTDGNWVATFNTSGNTFSWSASSSSVPDGGTSITLLGMALIGTGLLRRRL